MAVAITSPQSAVIARGKFTLAWTHTYPQAAYEVMYRKKGETAWSTFGRITGTATSITVDCSRFDDFVEYQYRVIMYSEYANTTETTYSGSDASAGYAFILVPDSMVGTMKVKYGDGMIEVPLYSTPQSGKQTISIGENKKTQLLNNDDSLSGSRSKVKVRTNNETKSLPRSDKYLSATGVDRYSSITEKGVYHISYSDYTNKTSGSYQYRYSDWSWAYDYDTGSKSYSIKESYDAFVGSLGTDIGNRDPDAYATIYYYTTGYTNYTYSYRYRDYYYDYDYTYGTYYYYYGSSANYYKYYYRGLN